MPHIIIGPVLSDEPSSRLFHFLDQTTPVSPGSPPFTLLGASSLDEGTHAAGLHYRCITLIYDDHLPGFEKRNAQRLAARVIEHGGAVSLLPLHLALSADLDEPLQMSKPKVFNLSV